MCCGRIFANDPRERSWWSDSQSCYYCPLTSSSHEFWEFDAESQMGSRERCRSIVVDMLMTVAMGVFHVSRMLPTLDKNS